MLARPSFAAGPEERLQSELAFSLQPPARPLIHRARHSDSWRRVAPARSQPARPPQSPPVIEGNRNGESFRSGA